MKQIFLSAFFWLLLCASCLAERKVSEYSMSYFDGEVFNIETTDIKNGKFSYFIYTKPRGNGKECGIELQSKNIAKFIEVLRSIEGKFEEWTKTAVDNNVTDFAKPYDVYLPTVSCFFKYGTKWKFTLGVKIKPGFMVTKSGKCVTTINLGELTASDNRYMHHPGMMLMFETVQEIEDFCNAIDPSLAQENNEVQQNKADLFQ